MVLGKLTGRSVLLIWVIVRQGSTALAEDAGFDIFFSHL